MAKSSTPIDISYASRKWTNKEKQQVADLREKGHGPKKISDITGFPIDQIKFWIYGDRQKKKYKRKKSKNSKANSMKSYYRMKYNNWFAWKASCYRSSLIKVSSKEEAATKKELEDMLIKSNKTCYYCAKELTQENISLDHKKPLARGGSSKIANLVLCCKDCNMTKGSLNGNEYKQLLKCVSKWEDEGQYLLGRLKGSNRFFIRRRK
jgi:5-methylcytosine-specific restriction endonuclease McrA